MKLSDLDPNVPQTAPVANDRVVLFRPPSVGGTAYGFFVTSIDELLGTMLQVSKSTNYTAIFRDIGKQLLHPLADNNARTFTIPANASVAFAIGTVLTFVNEINTLTIAITTDTLTWASDGTTGSRSLAASGMASALKVSATKWIIAGTGLS